jgi:hypothetical protein
MLDPANGTLIVRPEVGLEIERALRCVANPDADEFVCDVCDKTYVFPLRD